MGGNEMTKSSEDEIVYRLLKRAEIRRSIPHRKSNSENKPDRISDLLEEAAKEIIQLREKYEILDEEFRESLEYD